MGKTLLEALLSNISAFLLLPKDGIRPDLVQKYHWKAEQILKLLKPVLDAAIVSEIAFDEVLHKAFDELSQSVDRLTGQFENWQPLSSRICFVLQTESSLRKISTLALNIFQLLKTPHQIDVLSSSSLEHGIQKLKDVRYEQMSHTLEEALRDHEHGAGRPSSDILHKIANGLSLRSNQEILIEAVALEKVKENAEQAEKMEEAKFVDEMIVLVNDMHNRLVLLKQSQPGSAIAMYPDFCCPLSLELMTDPVIVASGQTYERVFIKKWIELGLTVCPKTRQPLAHTNLIPNYTVKQLIANWCESNNVELHDPLKSMNNQPSLFVLVSPGSSHVSNHSIDGQPMSPQSILSVDPPNKSLDSSRIQSERISPLHTVSTSEGSLSGMVGNGQVLDVEIVSPTSSDERSRDLDEKDVESVASSSVFPSRKEVSNAITADEMESRIHKSNFESSRVDADSSRGAQEDANESSQELNNMAKYDGNTSRNLIADEQPSSSLSNKGPYLPSRFSDARDGSEKMLLQTGRHVPKIVSSLDTEMRVDLSGLEAQVKKLVEDIRSTSVSTKRDAVLALRILAKQNTESRIVIANSGALNLLVDLLQSTDTTVQENAVTTLLNLSLNDNNKEVIANAGAIEPLIHVLKTGSPEAKENSAATLFSLSVSDSNKVLIGRAGAIEPLVDLLGNGTPRGKKDAATALFNLSISPENKPRVVQAGAVKHLVELMNPAAGIIDKAVVVLANLATIQEGRDAIVQEANGISVLVDAVEIGSTRGKENAAAALLHLCSSNKICNLVIKEGAVPPLVMLSHTGTPRAKEKAQQLLSRFRNQRHANPARS